MLIFFKTREILKSYLAFTLAEVLIVLMIVGIVAEVTLPNLVLSSQEKQYSVGLKIFVSTLQNAINSWKSEIGCYSDVSSCLSTLGLTDNNSSSFDRIAKFMTIADSAPGATNTKSWLPADTYNYYGTITSTTWGKVSKAGCSVCCYLLRNGMTFSVDSDQTGFGIVVDVNGAKPPNRMGKDSFPLVVGDSLGGKDIYLYSRMTNYANENASGLCGYSTSCDANNTNPTVGNGASPTAYTFLNDKIPDFKTLSKTVANFYP